MFILLIAKIALTPQIWKSTNPNKKVKNNKRTQPHRDGEAVFCFTPSPQRAGWYSYAMSTYGRSRRRSHQRGSPQEHSWVRYTFR